MLSKPLSLSHQVADAVRRGIRQGLWRERLPGERDLSRQLDVSRPTLRAALSLLQREGWLKNAQGRLRVIARKPARKLAEANPIVRLLLPFPLQQSPPFLFYWIDRLRELLFASDCVLEIHPGRRLFDRPPEKDLAAFVRHTPASAWLLARATRGMQQWFAASGLPTIIAGTCHPGIELPSVDFDHHAVARHAAVQLLVRGHRSIVMMLETPELAGDLEAEHGFVSAFDPREYPHAKPIVARHDGTLRGIRKELDRLLRLKPRPSGFFIVRSMPALAVASELSRRGFQSPKDAALISRDSDHFLEFFSPQPARYVSNPEPFSRRLATLVSRLARDGTVARRQVRLMPEFIKGETLG